MRKSILLGLICIALMLVINFVLPRFMPGDPVLLLIGDPENAVSSKQYETLRGELGLDLPLPQQFMRYLGAIAKGDIGYSYHYRKPVVEVIGARVPITLQIAVPAILLSTLLSLILGSYMGFRKNSRLDLALSSTVTFINAIPAFLMGMVFLSVFAFHARLFPLGGINSLRGPKEGIPFILDRAKHLALPIITVTLSGIPSKYLMVRNTVAAAKNDKYVVYAQARGLSRRRILFVHILKNVCPPFITLVGLNIGFMIAGSMVTEIVFSINGMGNLIYSAVSIRDFPILQGCLLFLSIVVVAANLLTDTVNTILDPRQRYGANK